MDMAKEEWEKALKIAKDCEKKFEEIDCSHLSTFPINITIITSQNALKEIEKEGKKRK